MTGITKEFGGVPVLRDVRLNIRHGEVHALMGENGAGKSTLMKILGGIHTEYGGRIEVDGAHVRFASPRQAASHGIAVIHQEFNLVPELSAAGNIFLGHEPRRFGCLIDQARLKSAAEALLRGLHFRGDPDQPVAKLRVGEQQLVEIAKALALNARILVMDEPTSALSSAEAEVLFAIIAALREQGVSIVYISHRMDEVFALADRITVLRDGCVVATCARGEITRRALISAMVGRDVEDLFARPPSRPGRRILNVSGLWLEERGRHLGRRRVIDGVSFDLREGEILGIGGLLGAGRTEILETLFGATRGVTGGEVRLDGRLIDRSSPAAAKAAGFAMVSEDRKLLGLVLGARLDANLSLPVMRMVAPAGWIDRGRETRLALETISALGIRATGPTQSVGTLSGGNQQKVVIGKWLAARPRVLLLDEPTRGVDVGAKAEIYRLIADLAGQGLAIVMVSSELPELIALSDRILVMREGRPTALLDRADISAETVMEYASPGGAVQERFRTAVEVPA
jgi:ribose transport system ATP-binding protein